MADKVPVLTKTTPAKMPETTPIVTETSPEPAKTVTSAPIVRKTTAVVEPKTTEQEFLDRYDLGDTSEETPVVTAKKEPEKEERLHNLGEYPDIDKADDPEEESETPAAKPKHPDWLRDMAIDVGIKASTIERLDTDALGEMVQAFKDRSDVRQDRRKDPEPEPEVDDLAELNDTIDPKVMARLRKADATDKKLAAMEKRLEQQERAAQLEKQQSAFSKIDAVFEAASAERNNLFGKGKQPANSPASERRGIIIAAVTQMERKNPGRSIEEYIKDAIDITYGKVKPKDTKPADKKTVNGAPRIKKYEPDEWDEGILASPTQRAEELPKGDERARSVIARRLAEMSGPAEQDEQDILDGFPD